MKENEKSTYGLSEQDVFKIKQMWYSGEENLDIISKVCKCSIAQSMSAINLNEPNPVTNFDN